jgi:hypothetical protein
MVAILLAVVSLFVFRFRSRAALELKLVALQHQLAVLRRQRPGRPQLSCLDRLLWVLLYRVWPQVIDAMVLVSPQPWSTRRLMCPQTAGPSLPDLWDLGRRICDSSAP